MRILQKPTNSTSRLPARGCWEAAGEKSTWKRQDGARSIQASTYVQHFVRVARV